MSRSIGPALLADVERVLPSAGEPPLQLAVLHDRVGYGARVTVACALTELVKSGRASWQAGFAQRSAHIVRLYRLAGGAAAMSVPSCEMRPRDDASGVALSAARDRAERDA
jgi:hypothetical protein